MSLLPIFLRLERRPVLVVGAGSVALAKIKSLQEAGAAVTVTAPQALAQIRALAQDGALTWRERVFIPADLEGVFLVIAATNDSAINHQVYEESLRRNVLCNAVDDPPNCDFYFGSVVARGNLQIAISTGGESPALAQRLRCEIDEQLPGDLAPWLAEVGGLRREIRGAMPAGADRNLLLHELARRSLCDSPSCPARELVRERIKAPRGNRAIAG